MKNIKDIFNLPCSFSIFTFRNTDTPEERERLRQEIDDYLTTQLPLIEKRQAEEQAKQAEIQENLGVLQQRGEIVVQGQAITFTELLPPLEPDSNATVRQLRRYYDELVTYFAELSARQAMRMENLNGQFEALQQQLAAPRPDQEQQRQPR